MSSSLFCRYPASGRSGTALCAEDTIDDQIVEQVHITRSIQIGHRVIGSKRPIKHLMIMHFLCSPLYLAISISRMIVCSYKPCVRTMRRNLTQHIADAIRRRIQETGDPAPGERLPTIRELRARYEVSLSTLAHALDLLVLEGVLERTPDGVCRVRQHTLKEATTLGLILPFERDDDLILRVYRGVERACRRLGASLISATSGLDYETERAEAYRLAASGCRALVVLPSVRTAAQARSDYVNDPQIGARLALIDLVLPHHRCSGVTFDNAAAAAELMRHMISEGRRRIRILRPEVPAAMEMQYLSVNERIRGARMAAGEAVDLSVESVSMHSRDAVHAHVKRWLNTGDLPDAVMAINDLCAVYVISSLQALGVSSPQQVRVVGYDNLTIRQAVWPPFPTTDPDFSRAGELAVELTMRPEPGSASRVYMLPAPVIWPHDAITDNTYPYTTQGDYA